MKTFAVNMPDPMSFSITGSDGSVGSVNSGECNTDWISIPCATNSLRPDAQSGGSPMVCVDRICGMVFNSVNSDFPSPSVPVNSKYNPMHVILVLYLSLNNDNIFNGHKQKNNMTNF